MSEGRRKKIKLTEEEEAGERLSRWRRRTLLLFPLWSSPEDLHLSPFPSPSLSLSRHQIEIPWWCFRLPVLSESFGIYFKPEETPQNLQCSLYPEPERECGGVRLLPVVISSLLLPSIKYFSGCFYLFFLWSSRLSRLVSPSDWAADLQHYAHGQKHQSVSLESETDCLHWDELPPALWLRCSSWQTEKEKKSFQTLPAVILTNQPSCQKNMCHNTSTLYVLVCEFAFMLGKKAAKTAFQHFYWNYWIF